MLRFRPPPGSNFELTRQMAIKCLEEIEREAGPENIAITMGYVGQVAPNFGIDNMVLFMRGPDDGQLRVALTEDSGIKLDEFRERLRKVLPERVIPWLAKRLEQGGLSQAEAERQAKLSTFGFEPGDIVTSVMSFGSSTPIAVRIVGTDLKMVRQHAEKIAANMRRIPFLRDVGFVQTLDYPTVEVDIDREKAGLTGATVEDVAHAAGHGDGVDPVRQPQLLDRREDRLRLPGPDPGAAAADGEAGRRRDLAGGVGQPAGQPDDPRRGDGSAGRAARRDRPRHVAALPDPDRQRRGRGHGPGIAARSPQALDAAGEPPRGVRVETMGQLPPMNEMFQSLGIGLAVAVFVIFVLLTAYFQSPRLALISIGAVPGVLAGIATILYFTNTSLNIESFMGSIMCLGVSVSNSVMLVTFIDEHWKTGNALGRGGHHRRERAAAADPDDRLRDDRGHGADGAGAGAGQPDAGPARPGGDRRAGDVHVRHLAGRPVDLRGRDRQEGGPRRRRSTRTTPRARTTTRTSTPARTMPARIDRTATADEPRPGRTADEPGSTPDAAPNASPLPGDRLMRPANSERSQGRLLGCTAP